MKEGWTYKKLGEVCDFEGGSQPPKSEWVKQPKEGYVRMLQIRDFTKSRESQIEYVKISKKLRLCKSDDILIGRYGASVGKILTGLAGAYNVAIIKSIPYENIISKEFIRRYFESSSFQRLLFKVCDTRTAQAGFSKDDIKDAFVPIPSLDEQQRIVERLDAAFENIDKLKANAEKQLAEAQTLFQKSLAKAMEPKEGWKEKKLKDIAQVRIGPFGSLLHKKDYISGGIPLVNPIHMVNGNIVANNDYTISDVKAKELSNYLLKENDIVFARRGEVGRCAIVTGEDEGFLCGTGSLFVRFLREIDSNFMLMLFQSDYCKNYLEHNASGATMLNINAGIVEDMPLTLPPLAEQQRIVERLDALSENIRKYEEIQRQIISECDALKQALLRKVFE
ncbi:type I restriction enzyme, S subunit [Xylanibacter ruminicola]|uniref:restriction endonuclease subunit S n=1 Tax=Xylanibacter ruminicola TaxID=839 RepID=UPI0008EC36E4|nr:restriction endonuclease subunit S [Xylanibacter ruminicola]SFC81358.1 type I restriction enzyme, S subunit [Xylanibacter ruminicola]